MQRLWLIDAGYVFKSHQFHQQRASTNYQIDYKKLRAKLEEDGKIWKAYYLNSVTNNPPDWQVSFHTWLKTGPSIIVKLYKLNDVDVDRAYCEQENREIELRCPNDPQHRIYKRQQKGVDVGITTLALKLVDRYDGLILSSGDGDLLDAIQYITEEKGKRFELAVFRSGVSPDLQALADNIYWIDDFASEIAR